jgi:DNA modification methylase
MRRKKRELNHIERAIPPEAHTPMYNWHKFWTRKPHNVVAEYIEQYSEPGDIILDPFAGSGVTIMESLKAGRRAIGIDILPVAVDLWKATIERVDLELLDRDFTNIEKKVKNKILGFYKTICRSFNKTIITICTIWKNDEPQELRYKCPYCGDIQEKGCKLNSQDKKILSSINSKTIRVWYPTNVFYYPNGTPFMTEQDYDSVDKLFTKRNLYALAILYRSINETCSKTTIPFMKLVFSSMVHLCSKMCPVRPTRPFSSLWSQHSFWVPPEYMESNVWEKFNSAYRGHQDFISGKIDAKNTMPNVTYAKSLNELGKKNKMYIPICKPALRALRDLQNENLKLTGKNKPFVDYVFTDPPYAGSVQFGESSYLWISWLYPDLDAKAYLQTLIDHEVVLNEQQEKPFDRYYSMLHATFKEVARVLKPGGYMHLTFHNPTTKVRNATIRAAMYAGFVYEKIIYQPPPRSSALALLRPFGSADGDFYFRFRKAKTDPLATMKEADEHTFERIVVDTTIQVLAERGEPTPYTHIINYIDPVLAKHGYFLRLHPEKDVDDILRDHIGKKFELVNQKIGDVEGQAWWFKDMNIVYRLDQIPLTERIEGTVVRELQSEYAVNFTDVLKKVYTEFPNALTPDTTNVKDILQEYGERTSDGMWRLKQIEYERKNHHSEMIHYLAQLGQKLDYRIHVGIMEQSKTYMMKELKSYNSQTRLFLKGLSSSQHKKVELIDVLWYRDSKIKYVFEVENTTMLTDAIIRASYIPYPVKKFMLLPLDRNRLLHRKLHSPLFSEIFQREDWKILYYEDLRKLQNKKGLTIDDLENASGIKRLEIKGKNARKRSKIPSNQTSIYFDDDMME